MKNILWINCACTLIPESALHMTHLMGFKCILLRLFLNICIRTHIFCCCKYSLNFRSSWFFVLYMKMILPVTGDWCANFIFHFKRINCIHVHMGIVFYNFLFQYNLTLPNFIWLCSPKGCFQFCFCYVYSFFLHSL